MIANVKVYLNSEFLVDTDIIVTDVNTMLTDPLVAEQLQERAIPEFDRIDFQREIIPN